MKNIVEENDLNDQGSFRYILIKVRKQASLESDFDGQNNFIMRFNDSFSTDKLESLLQKLFKSRIR